MGERNYASHGSNAATTLRNRSMVVRSCEAPQLLRSEPPAHDLVYRHGGRPLGVRVGACVDVERHRRVCMAHDRAHGLDVDSLCDCESGEGVTEVVEGRPPALRAHETHRVCKRLPRPPEPMRLHERAVHLTEDVDLGHALLRGLEARDDELGLLSVLPCLQLLCEGGCEGDVAHARARLGRLDVVLSVIACHRPPHPEGAVLEVHVGPPEAAELALAHSGGKRHEDGEVEGSVRGCVEVREERAPRALAEGVGHGVLRLGRPHGGERVPGDEVCLDGLLAGALEQDVGLAYRGA